MTMRGARELGAAGAGRSVRAGLLTLAALLALACGPARAQTPAQTSAQTSANEPLRVLAVERPPFVMKDRGGDFTGFSVDLWREIATRLKFDYEIHEQETFADMLGAVSKGEADLAIGNISITSQREAVLDFSQPFLDSGLQILVREDVKGAPHFWRALWNSPAPAVAGFCVLTLLAVAHLMWLLERRRNPQIRESYLAGVWDSLWWAFITVTTGGAERPASAFSRVFAMVWVLVGLLFVSSLTASITTFFTVQHLSGDISSTKDLVGMKVGLAEGTTMARYARANGVPFKSYADTRDVIRALETGEIKATFLDAPVAQYYALNDGAGKARLAGRVFARDKLGMAFPNGSDLRETVDRALLQAMEQGVYDKLHTRYFGQD